MDSREGGIVVTNEDSSSLDSKVKERQDKHPILLDLKANVHKQSISDFYQGGDGMLKCKGRFCA